ncbi:MAG: TRAP transporter small permease [Roseobacter sp.]
MYQKLNSAVDFLARAMAITGGAVLLVIVFLTCISIIGRMFVPFDIGIGPIRGVYDMTEIGMAAAIFAFLPWAQYSDAHARVDLFETVFPTSVNRLLELIFHIAMTGVAYVIAWRLYLGMSAKYSYGETTLIAQIEIWKGFAAGLVGAVVFLIVSAFCVLRSARRLVGHPE